VIINERTLNARTYAMLQQAALLYGGEIDVAGKAILRGSYGDEPLDGLGVHLGGGAVDISVARPKTQSVLYTEIEPLIRALRTVGFAAWLRDAGEIGSGSEVYIQAVAIGDADLSPAAQEQITGPAGYLRGYDGLPVTSGDPQSDRHGGPLICRWMLEAGYADLRTPTPIPTPGIAWQERLRQAAMTYQAQYPEDAEKVARSLNFLDGRSESAENICGPLAAAILRDAGLLPTQPGPVQELKSYWQARPSTNGRPWSLFSERDYEVFRFDTPLAEFDFSAWPLQPGDFLYTYAKDLGFEHMFVVTEVDAEGRAYTVTNQYQSWGNEIWGSMLILRYLLYDPTTPGAGIIYNEWSDPSLGKTGHNGFEVLRKRGLEAGSLYAYTVRPGDTLPDLAARFEAVLESIVEANPGVDLANLQVGQTLTIPIPSYPQD
jgi:nucleoid-associated protein YgaU